MLAAILFNRGLAGVVRRQHQLQVVLAKTRDQRGQVARAGMDVLFGIEGVERAVAARSARAAAA